MAVSAEASGVEDVAVAAVVGVPGAADAEAAADDGNRVAVLLL